MIYSQEIILGILVVAILLLSIALLRLEIKMRRFFKGKNGKDLEKVISSQEEAIKKLNVFENESKNYFKNIEHRMRKSVQSVETIRFNAFRGDGIGGNQSFATAFINEKGDGGVISSLYSRERVSIFSKPIKKFESEIELSEEEKRVISLAKAKLKD